MLQIIAFLNFYAIVISMKEKIRYLVFVACFFCCISISFSQSSESVSKMIETEVVSCGQAGYFFAVYLDLVPETSGEAEALDALSEFGVYKCLSSAEVPVTYSQLAGMCMKSCKIDGGLMYKITKADHYAFRELQSKGYIPFSADPGASVSGYQTLNLINRCIEQIEKEVSQ